MRCRVDGLLPVSLPELAHIKVVVLLKVGLASLCVQVAKAILSVVNVSADGAAIQPPV